MGNSFPKLTFDNIRNIRYIYHSKPVGPLLKDTLSLGGYFLNFPIDTIENNRYNYCSIPAGLLSKDMLTSAGFSFFTPARRGLI